MTNPPTDSTHECPAPDCEQPVRKHQFACPVDWVRLPAELRRGINDGYQRDWGQWTTAAEAAIAWFEQHPAATS
jgi:hypothetical protein